MLLFATQPVVKIASNNNFGRGETGISQQSIGNDKLRKVSGVER